MKWKGLIENKVTKLLGRLVVFVVVVAFFAAFAVSSAALSFSTATAGSEQSKRNDSKNRE